MTTREEFEARLNAATKADEAQPQGYETACLARELFNELEAERADFAALKSQYDNAKSGHIGMMHDRDRLLHELEAQRAAHAETRRQRDEIKARLDDASKRSGGTFLLMLDEYERTNLLAALECIMTLPHFSALHTGDWTGMIRWALGEPELKPNRSVEDIRSHVERWQEQTARVATVLREHGGVIRNALLFEMQLTRGTPDEPVGRKAFEAASALAEVLEK